MVYGTDYIQANLDGTAFVSECILETENEVAKIYNRKNGAK